MVQVPLASWACARPWSGAQHSAVPRPGIAALRNGTRLRSAGVVASAQEGRGLHRPAITNLLPCADVSIRAPARGATRHWVADNGATQFRSALPRGERHGAFPRAAAGDQVSIRAPARGATARPGGATGRQGPFRSALPRGERHKSAGFIPVTRRVSIRAPARGATQSDVLAVVSVAGFDPRSRAGSDQPGREVLECAWFRSALPRGERPGPACSWSRPRCFDPRSRAGSDDSITFGPELRQAFRSALPRGERRVETRRARARGRFRSALPRGERREARRQASRRRRFDPRSRAGSDIRIWPACPQFARFRSALPRGERLTASKFPPVTTGFRSALPRGERPQPIASSRSLGRFRSALPRGERQQTITTRRQSAVSIRAPARGATHTAADAAAVYGFDPRSRAGSDGMSVQSSQAAVFRSALPRGERPGCRCSPRRRPCFDPRSRAGSDDAGGCGAVDSRVSIRAPARGATLPSSRM